MLAEMLFSLVERVFVINLPDRRDRRREMAGELARIGHALPEPGLEIFPAIRPESAGPFASIGARGCFMSHLGALRAARDAGARSVAVFEDDAAFSDDFADRFAIVVNSLHDRDWRMFFGGHERMEPPPPDGPMLRPLDPATVFETSHFVMYRGEAIGVAVDFLETLLTRPAGSPLGGPMHFDGAINWLRAARPDFECWIAVPPLARQRASRSDIAEDRRWFDRTPIARNAAAMARRLRDTARRRESRPSRKIG